MTVSTAPACLLCRGPVDDPDDHLCPGCRDDQDSTTDERLRSGRHHNAWTPSVLVGPPYRLTGGERGAVRVSTVATALGLFVGGAFIYLAPIWVVIAALAIPVLWLGGAALWDLAHTPDGEPELSAWDVQSSHDPDQRQAS
ncbi:hypothetical protein [Phycicoccus jejuensis]|uniref:hypothetical protein n=1 Tax=Phycicoccus jejuensis TaxID=367299 RepID=UPI0004C3C3DD|nr:hypothetical protein [Phycicoccus jejuensis]